MENKDRALVKMIKEICAENGIRLDSFSYDWILKLESGGKQGFIFGYGFGINTASASAICNDKSAASEILLFSGVPVIEHYLYMSPGNIRYVGEKGNWSRLEQMLGRYKALVCKPNEGTGGNSVYLVRNQFELEEAAHAIFESSRTMAACPYYEIDEEYRAVVLDYSVKLIFAKKIPFITGDGRSTVKELILSYLKENDVVIENRIGGEQPEEVLGNGERLNLNWKHNLCRGASPSIIENGPAASGISELAVKAAKAIGVRFASVDIAQTKEGLKVLEVNSGVMMENFSRLSEQNYMAAKNIYREAVGLMLKQDKGNNN